MKKFLLSDINIEKNSYVWNMIGSMLQAFQSVIMLMILTRTVGIIEAGIFTIAYANANLFLTIGKFGMRYFQVSDVKRQYSFSDYLFSRKITAVTMGVVSITYVIFASNTNDYSHEKSLIIIVMCLFKVADVIEDVYCGMYQQKGRLDIASRVMAVRLAFTILVFGTGILTLRNQLYALCIATMFTYVLLYLFLKWTYAPYKEKKETLYKGKVISLLKACFPLFLGSFLSFYIGNAPKYAIDTMLSDELQACYGFVAMPVFVIGLLNNFIFNPILFQLSILWTEGKVRSFLKRVGIQAMIVLGITCACLIGAYLIGVPVLSVMYNTDLSPYKAELLILLVGGGFLGLSGLLNAVITIIRFQKWIAYGYFVVAGLAFFLSRIVVGKYGIFGAALLYTSLMGGLSACFGVILVMGIVKRNKENRIGGEN